MSKHISIVFLFTLSLIFTSCSEKDIYTPLEMFDMAYKFDNTIEEVRIAAKDKDRHLECSDYPQEGCLKGSPKRFKVRLVEMIVVQYMTTRDSCRAAAKIGQWHARNWLLDDVTGEPVLEDFVKKVYKAKKPKTIESCN
ncbi:hypothetical protein DAY19_12870 [Halobacteriovorax vibrionivorans]|uniref:Lipoprotein n=1 Tax=Halobacteriovorax vibrionivorans TaxID=2152716 RepID=A0ABY0IEF5_9BACT|nr:MULTISPECIES: hypothetical protein [Halobacteriovorax]RZF20870.1 hypothetical protein DAY19_12870 [Halobacteriovorax vibrionivorans]TGD46221.1 hypothetical protein EP118_12880 [Halobacteriovorax sp. Y22]